MKKKLCNVFFSVPINVQYVDHCNFTILKKFKWIIYERTQAKCVWVFVYFSLVVDNRLNFWKISSVDAESIIFFGYEKKNKYEWPYTHVRENVRPEWNVRRTSIDVEWKFFFDTLLSLYKFKIVSQNLSITLETPTHDKKNLAQNPDIIPSRLTLALVISRKFLGNVRRQEGCSYFPINVQVILIKPNCQCWPLFVITK